MKDHVGYTEKSLSPEQIVCIAEKGLRGANLSKAEKQYLNTQQLEEVYAIWDFEKETIPEFDPNAISDLLKKYTERSQKHSIADICIKLGKKCIELIQLGAEWQTVSPAFAVRDNAQDNISFHKSIGKLTIHLEIVHRDQNLADIHVKLTNSSKKNSFLFDVELIKDNRCVETINTAQNDIVSFLSVAIDNYILRVSDAKKEIASLSLRMEQ